MGSKAIAWILAIALAVTFIPVLSFGGETNGNEVVVTNEVTEVQELQPEDYMCEADVDPSLRETVRKRGADLVEARKVAHSTLRELLDNYADMDYYGTSLQEEYSYYGEDKLNEITSIATEATADCNTDYEKIKAIYDLVAENIYYDYDYYNGETTTTSFGFDAWQTQTTVCAGYAQLCSLFLKAIDIPCIELTGENHAYNAAYDSQNERWIFFDSTWGSSNSYRNGEKRYGKHSDSYFDMSVNYIAGLNNHECYNRIICLVSNDGGKIRSALSNPATVNDWPDINSWEIKIVSEKDKTVETVDIGDMKLCGIPVTVIENGAFNGCNSLTDIILPNSLKSIEDSVFRNCTSLTSISIPESVTSIGYAAFEGCNSLTDITLPSGVTAVLSHTFSGCSSLTDITIPNGVETIGDYGFYKCTGLTDISLPSSLKTIGEYTFRECSNLKSIVIPEGVTSIKKHTFYGCGSLTDITLPDSLETIELYSFGNCGLTRIAIPDSVTNIAGSAFIAIESKLVIYCNRDSYVHSFAASRGIKYKLWTSLEDCTVGIDKEEYCATGRPIKPAITVVDGDTVLTEGEQFAVSESDAVMGETSVTVTGLDNYSDEVVISFRINEHQWSDTYTVDKPANCLEEGSESLHCIACDAIKEGSERTIEKTQHNYGDWHVVTPVTCTEDGIRQKVCLICNDIITETITSPGHHEWEEEYTIDVPASCTMDGEKSIHCSVCGERTDITVAPATGHSFGDWETLKPNGCQTTGYEKRTCEVCGYSETKKLDPTGHAFSESYTLDKEPNCIEDGSESMHCKYCGEILDSRVIPATGHDIVEHGYKEPTCTEEGNYPYETCKNCDYTTYEPIQPTGHNVEMWNIIGEEKCTEPTTVEGTCTICGELVRDTIGATGHIWNHYKIAPGLHRDGKEYDQCFICGTKQNVKTLAGYASYYVKSFKVSKGKKSFTAKWAKQSAANQKKFNGYQIRYSLKANMSGAKYAKAAKSSKSKKISKLKKKTTYYVQVRTYTVKNGKTFYSKWSPKKSVKTK